MKPSDAPTPAPRPSLHRRAFLGAAAGAALAGRALARQEPATAAAPVPRGVPDRPTLVGSANAYPGMLQHYAALTEGGDPLDVAIEVVKLAEANEKDNSVGLGGFPNEAGVVSLDAACMYGPTHNSGAVGCIENILHPSEVARLVMERTDHCLIVGKGAYDFAREHGHPHTELLTEPARRAWVAWKERRTDDDRLPAQKKDKKGGFLYEHMGEQLTLEDVIGARRLTGTIHCSALSTRGEVACTTTTSGLSWKIPGRVGDSPIVGAGLYCDNEAGSAGATGRGEAAILANGSFAIVELMRGGMGPEEAGLEVLRRVTRQAQRAASWQPELLNERGLPNFNLQFYILGLDGTTAGVALYGSGSYAVADPDNGPQKKRLTALHG
jgi:N4-(beta-N-acetylglucosaminyl)-L-asparaginase